MFPWENDFYLTCVGAVTNTGLKEVIWFDHCTMDYTADGVKRIQELVDHSDLIVGHNLKHDVNILRSLGIDFERSTIWCTMITEYLLSGQDVQGRGFSLNDVASHYGFPLKDDQVRSYWDQGYDTYDIPAQILEKYVLRDCELPIMIYEQQLKAAKVEQMLKVITLQNEFIFSLSDIELNGFRFDVDRAHQIVEEYKARCDEIENEIRGMMGEPHLNIGSSIQLSAVLFGGMLKLKYLKWVMVTLKSKPETKYYEKMMSEERHIEGAGFEPTSRVGKNGYYSTDKDTLHRIKAKTPLQRKLKKLLLEFRAASKVVETLRGKTVGKGLLSKVMSDGKIHPKVNQGVTKTGRLTSSNPNSQNLPRGNTSPIKKCIVPTLDGIFQIDLSQVEWRAAGELANDEVMIHEVNAGVDQHIETCTQLMELPFISKADKKSKENRNHAKVFNFRMIYGGSFMGFYMDLNMPNFSMKKWKSVIRDFFAKYHGLRDWHIKNVKHVFSYGTLTVPTGRKFVFQKTALDQGVPTYSQNQIKNYPVQGVAGGDILPLMVVIIRRGMKKLNLKSKIILTVHDSLVIDYAEEELETLVKLCYRVANNLHSYIKSYYKINWRTKLEGEIEVGPNYAELEFVPEGD